MGQHQERNPGSGMVAVMALGTSTRCYVIAVLVKELSQVSIVVI